MAEKISIILPVYNVEDYLPKCLDSIGKQMFRDFRVIAVNDGSTDRSGEILNEWAEKVDYCSVITKENGGLASARNAGLKEAKGEFVVFIDSDDYVEPDYLLDMYNLCIKYKADIACCFFYYYFPEIDFNLIHPLTCSGVYTPEQAISLLFHDKVLQSYAWDKMYRRSLFTDNNIEFPQMYYEDMATSSRLFGKAKRIAVTKKRLYHYTQRSSSILKTQNYRKVDDFLRATASMRIHAEQDGTFDKLKKPYSALCRKTGIFAKMFAATVHSEDKNVINTLRDFRKIQKALDFYKSDKFVAADYYDKPISSIPSTLEKET